jgi:hypothetical protein
MAGRPPIILVASMLMYLLISALPGYAQEDTSLSILVDYPGSWQLRYKVFFSEIGDSEEHHLTGIGRREIQVSGAEDAVMLCAWLESADTQRGVDMRLSILVQRGSRRDVKSSPRSLGRIFSRRKSVCYHFGLR